MDITTSYDPIAKKYGTIPNKEVSPIVLNNFIKTTAGDCLLLSGVYNPLSLLINKVADRQLLSEAQGSLENKLRLLFRTDFEGSNFVQSSSKTYITVYCKFAVLEVTI